jgi:hypothetical protein
MRRWLSNDPYGRASILFDAKTDCYLMSDIFREVDEEVRRSKAEAFWGRYGGLIIGGCALLVIGVAGYRFYDYQKQKAAAEAGAKFETALQLIQTGKTSEGETALNALAGEQSGIYQTLAKFRAATELGKRDAPAAIKAFDALAADAALDGQIRDIARFRAASIAADILPLADLEARMAPLLNPTSGWRHPAQEILAASAIKSNAMDKARQYLDSIIIDRTAPQAVKSRAELLIGLTRGTK